jgi:hypothetical protein
MNTFNEITDALFGESNPGGKFLLCLATYIPLIMLQDHFKSKMNEIARRQDPTLFEDNPFTRLLLHNTEVWNNPEWRGLKTRHTLIEYISFIPLLVGIWFGFESVILIGGYILLAIF